MCNTLEFLGAHHKAIRTTDLLERLFGNRIVRQYKLLHQQILQEKKHLTSYFFRRFPTMIDKPAKILFGCGQ